VHLYLPSTNPWCVSISPYQMRMRLTKLCDIAPKICDVARYCHSRCWQSCQMSPSNGREIERGTEAYDASCSKLHAVRKNKIPGEFWAFHAKLWMQLLDFAIRGADEIDKAVWDYPKWGEMESWMMRTGAVCLQGSNSRETASLVTAP
jgi:hypothetical protein